MEYSQYCHITKIVININILIKKHSLYILSEKDKKKQEVQ